MEDQILEMLRSISERLDAIETAMGGGSERPSLTDRRDGSKYPWSKLDTEGKFFFACAPKDKAKVQASVSANSIKRFGKGAIKVKQAKGGIWVVKKSS